MMNHNLPASDIAGVVAAINPTSQSAGTQSTSWISAANYTNFLAVVQAGVLGASATLDAKIEQATDSSGTGAKDVTGKAITQLTKAGSDDSKQALIAFRQADLDIANDYTHVRLSVTVATAASLTAALLLGFGARYGVASGNDAASVDEIVA